MTQQPIEAYPSRVESSCGVRSGSGGSMVAQVSGGVVMCGGRLPASDRGEADGVIILILTRSPESDHLVGCHTSESRGHRSLVTTAKG